MAKTIYSEDHKHIIKQLIEARKSVGFDQIKVAKAMKKSQSYISKMESGQRKIGIVQLKEFAKIYKKDLSFFVK